jgi:signal transduction histidine kinase
MEYRNRLMGKVSKCILHDIATPLSIISGSLKLFDKEKHKNVQPLLMDSTEYLESILEDALSIVDGKRNEKIFNLSFSIKRVLNLLNYRITNSRIKINTCLDETLSIKGYENSFSRIFLNIFLNAIEELESIDRKKKYININLFRKKKVLILKVQDNGMGISKNVIGDISVGKYISSSESHFGLGLLFVLSSVKGDFNGSVNINSKKGKYSEVIIKIPYR